MFLYAFVLAQQTASALISLQDDCEVLHGEVSKAKQEASGALVTSKQMANENTVLERKTKVHTA